MTKHYLDVVTREEALKAVQQDGLSLKFQPESFRADEGVVQAAVTQNGLALRYASKAQKNNPDTVMVAVKQNKDALSHATEHLRGDRNFMLKMVRHNVGTLYDAEEALRANRKFMLDSIEIDADAFDFASEQLIQCDAFKRDAIRRNTRVMLCAEEGFTFDDEVLAALRANGLSLEYTPKDLIDEPLYVHTAVTQNGRALQFAPQSFREDRETVLAAVRSAGLDALQYASKDLQSDRLMQAAATVPLLALAMQYPLISSVMLGITVGLLLSSIATPAVGITAGVLVAASFFALNKLSENGYLQGEPVLSASTQSVK